MKLSVLIPTYARPIAINQCLAHLAAQVCTHPFEIIIGLDGPAPTTPDPLIPDSICLITTILRLDHSGLIAVRKKMLDHATGQLILWLNDDSYAHPNLLQTHIDLHLQQTPCVIAGAAQWKPIAQSDHPNLFDLLVQRSDLLFFQPKANTTEPSPTNYRNCFGLNMSFDRKLAARVGNLPTLPESYGYEDIELAYRLNQAGAQILHAPSAIVTHDHRYRPVDVHRREYLLGRSAWHFANINPAFAHDLFKRDITAASYLDYIAQSLIHERRDALRIERSFLALADQPANSINPGNQPMLDLLAQHWVPLKRYLWRQGLLDSSRSISPRWSLLQDSLADQ
ncbi:MAG: glycosyltransferase family 2 protein [Phycisphaerales bacterium]|nr:glycosyltransferase family 2 protein [Phycisphaerales bacterium]